MGSSGVTRRQLLAGTGASVALAALGPLAQGCIATGGPYEGIYTDRFTYSPGQQIHFHVALHNRDVVNLDVYRMDTPVVTLFGTYPIQATRTQRLDDPGINGAGFDVALSLSASDFPPGIYHARIPPEALLESNRQNLFNGFVSFNNFCLFVVTAAVPGSHSRLLWIHDTLTPTCYGSFGARSIYAGGVGFDPAVQTRTVSYARPGLDRTLGFWQPLVFLRQQGYEFEYVDSVALSQAPEGWLDAYDLVMCVGQIEYVTHALLDQLASYLDGGGNLFAASDEFGIFRVRLDPALLQLTTYKFDWEQADPLTPLATESNGLGRHIAGVGMNLPASHYETEIIGQTCWAAHRVTTGAIVDLPTYHHPESGWILEGTGLNPGDPLPGAFNWFASGNLVEFDDRGEPFLVEQERTRMPEGSVVWAAVPSPDGRAWWLADGRDVNYWPLVQGGHATATLQQRASGAQVVTLPSINMATYLLVSPIYRTMLSNVVGRLSRRA